jgi:hypothetical protein
MSSRDPYSKGLVTRLWHCSEVVAPLVYLHRYAILGTGIFDGKPLQTPPSHYVTLSSEVPSPMNSSPWQSFTTTPSPPLRKSPGPDGMSLPGAMDFLQILSRDNSASHLYMIIVRCWLKFIDFVCFTVLRIESGALHLLGKCSSKCSPSFFFLCLFQ